MGVCLEQRCDSCRTESTALFTLITSEVVPERKRLTAVLDHHLLNTQTQTLLLQQR